MLFAAAAAFCASLSFTAPADKNAHLAEGEQIQVAYLGGDIEYETDWFFYSSIAIPYRL